MEDKMKKFIKVGVLAICIVALLAVLLIAVIIPNFKLSKQYDESVELMNSGKYAEAIKSFEKIMNYKDSAEMIEKIKLSSIEKAEIGDSVWFGAYEQDNNLENGKETVEWIVLDKVDGKIVVTSKKGLDYKSYNDEQTEVTWENSSIRKWLNGEFYNESFSDKEKEMISKEMVINYESVNFETGEYEKVYDNIFLLTNFEVEYYMAFADRRREPTNYALSQKDWHNLIGTDDEFGDNCEWWTRSAEEDYWGFSYQYGFVEKDGNLSWRMGDCVTTMAVLPAMWIKVE
ncbi:MAG: DUF6273 domain-containing protein [Clostridia bacterium]|nr:DUF6273 domain-containing protein [Clostridia bacterium]